MEAIILESSEALPPKVKYSYALFLNIHPRESPTHMQWRLYKRIFMPAVFTIAKPANDPNANHWKRLDEDGVNKL